MNLEEPITSELKDYRVETVGERFVVIDPAGEQVGIYETETAAQESIESCRKEDAMWRTARIMFDIAVKSHMQMHGVDRRTSLYWLRSASEAAE